MTMPSPSQASTEFIHPYVSPVVWGFEQPGFHASASAAREQMLARLAAAEHPLDRVGPWLRRSGQQPEFSGPWRPKLYLCVGPADYWRVVERVHTCTTVAAHSIALKTFVHADPKLSIRDAAADDHVFARPDKIVVYTGLAPLELLVDALAACVGEAQTHTLAHTAALARHGLGAGVASEAIRVAADPRFLSVSWRTYEAFARTWLAINAAVVDAEYGSDAWLARMNIAPDGGPSCLDPDVATTRFIGTQWRRIVGDDFDGIY
ncbi:hypothetical protein G6O69_35200 [Pseudenhygromyxa sp. WMMC2535]|uniref:hypothetical protein n=1 Tax=Pseudenhygromyxa sp. WMMC2535 TaxID=2712867 RepID=UPI0015517801|nr:hypothetical protein [Pseudenhygromyxa sp. WMMC2535]NVB43124.1 hypothetical protein [Pseudenhygromyxa sp. WMMC2535]